MAYKEKVRGERKQLFYSTVLAGSLLPDGLNKKELYSTFIDTFGVSKHTLDQWLKEVSGQVFTRNGRLWTVNDASLLTTTSHAHTTKDNRINDGLRGKERWRSKL